MAESFLPRPVVKELRAAVGTVNTHTGRGVDALGPSDVKVLPPAAEEELIDPLCACETLGTWPWQLLTTITVLAAKPDGGERDISLLAVLVRTHARLRATPTRELCDSCEGWWDTAIAESEPLRAALARACRM